MPRTSYGSSEQQGLIGAQALLVFSSVPATATQLGQRVNGAVLTVLGDYYADIDISGLAQVEAFLKATLVGGATLASDVYTTYADETTKKTAFAGIGALVTATLQTVTLAATKGERVARVKLTLGVGGSATITQAEYNGN